MRKLLSLVLASMFLIGLLAIPAMAEDVEVKVYNLKVEINEAITNFAKRYTEATDGVTVTVETLGGGADYGGGLKAKLASDSMPDIFMIEGRGGYDLWEDYLLDMGDTDWVKDTELYYAPEGTIVGFPIGIEGFGLGYNAEILEKADIDPTTLTTLSATKAAFEKLDSMKAELGIDNVVSVGTSVSGGLWWVTSQHVFNSFYAGYLDYNDSSVYDNTLKGELDQERLTAFTHYLKMLFDYADPSILVNGSYDDQVAAFAQGKTAFITQGNWIDPNMKQLGAEFKMGFVGHNFLEQESSGLYIAPPSYFVVNSKASPEKQKAAIDFLNHMALTEDGAKYMVEEAGMVPAFKSVTLMPPGDFSRALVEANARGGNYNWYFGQNPDGFNTNTLGPIFELLATDGDVDAFINDVTEAFKGLN